MKPKITKTPIESLFIIEPKVFGDDRGHLFETYHVDDYADLDIDMSVFQTYQSRSAKTILRGLHYQDATAPIAKIVRCNRGAILDVALDIRSKSSTFGQWFGINLTEENKLQLYVPVGFAHGFLSLSDITEVHYHQSGGYSPQAEGCILWDDPKINIKWGIKNPLLSDKDLGGMSWEIYQKKSSLLIGVTGAGGLLGSELVRQGCVGIPREANFLGGFDIIVHCAAKTDVNECEKYPDLTTETNVELTRRLANVSKVKLVYISTEYVFDGKDGPYDEKNISFNPLNIYGWSKLGGEIVIRNRQADDLIVRITTPFGIHPKKPTLVSKVVEQLKQGNTLTFSDSLISSPSYIPHIAKGIIDAINFNLTGILNIAGSQIMTLRYFAQNIAYVWGYDEEVIKSGEFLGGVPRPQKAGLVIDKAKTHNIFIGNPIDGLKEMKDALETVEDRRSDNNKSDSLERDGNRVFA